MRILLMLLFATLTGCGTKGPLYIPEQRYPQPAPTEAPANAPTSAPASQ